ncbi:MAG: hypothetical protein KIS96_02505 [Bauldia sp.]|nr:hypothetical protein [Bauldia sp.]
MTAVPASRRAAAALPFLFAGLIVWAVRFLAVYGFTAIACVNGWSGAVPVVIVAASVVAIAVNGVVIAAGLRRNGSEAGRFLGLIAAAVAALSIIAIVFETLPAFLVDACAA